MATKPLERKEHILKDGEKVYFKWRDPTPGGSNLGRAEFSICPVYVRGKLKEMYIDPIQQRNSDTIYKAVFDYPPLDFTIQSFGLDDPKIWLHYWCKRHKCAGFRLYVPDNAEYFQVDFFGDFSINFCKGE